MVEGWITCFNDHIIGYVYENEYIINQYSSLSIKYPTNEVRKLTERHLEESFESIRIQEQHFIKEREKRISYLKCDLCNINSFNSSDDYLTHVNINKIHKENLTELIEEDFEEEI